MGLYSDLNNEKAGFYSGNNSARSFATTDAMREKQESAVRDSLGNSGEGGRFEDLSMPRGMGASSSSTRESTYRRDYSGGQTVLDAKLEKMLSRLFGYPGDPPFVFSKLTHPFHPKITLQIPESPGTHSATSPIGFFGPYSSMGDIWNHRGHFIFLANDSAKYGIGIASGCTPHKDMISTIQKVSEEIKKQHNLILGKDFKVAIRYEWPGREKNDPLYAHTQGWIRPDSWDSDFLRRLRLICVDAKSPEARGAGYWGDPPKSFVAAAPTQNRIKLAFGDKCPESYREQVYFGPYYNLLEIADHSGVLVPVVFRDGNYIPIGAEMATGQSFLPTLRRVVPALAAQGHHFGSDYGFAVQYHWPSRGFNLHEFDVKAVLAGCHAPSVILKKSGD